MAKAQEQLLLTRADSKENPSLRLSLLAEPRLRAKHRLLHSKLLPQNSGFLIGRFGLAPRRLKDSKAPTITADKCRKFFDDTLAALRQKGEVHSGFQTTPTTLAHTLSITTINKYSSDLTAKAVESANEAGLKLKTSSINLKDLGLTEAV